MINKQFMEITNNRKIIDGKVYVLCKCFCGDEKWFSERLIKTKGVNSCGCLGTVPYSIELTDEFLVSTEPQVAKLLLEFNGMKKEEVEKYYKEFRKRYLEDKTWI